MLDSDKNSRDCISGWSTTIRSRPASAPSSRRSELGSLFTIDSERKAGGDPAAVEKAVNEELTRLLVDGPTQDELDRVKTLSMSGFVRAAERIGGFGGKSDILASIRSIAAAPTATKSTLAVVRSRRRPPSIRWPASDGSPMAFIAADVAAPE